MNSSISINVGKDGKAIDKNNEWKSFLNRETENKGLGRGWGSPDSEKSNTPIEIMDTLSDVADKLTTLDLLIGICKNIKVLKVIVNTFCIVDSSSKVLHRGDNIRRMNNLKKLFLKDKIKDENNKEIVRDYIEKDPKKGSIKIKYYEMKRRLKELTQKQKKLLLNPIERLELIGIRENIIANEVKEVNVVKCKSVFTKAIIKTFESISDFIAIMTFPIAAVIAASMKLAISVIKFFDVATGHFGEWIGGIGRRKQEEAKAKATLSLIKEEVGKDKLEKYMDEKILNKSTTSGKEAFIAKNILEKQDDEIIKNAYCTALNSVQVFEAKPNILWRAFNLSVVDDYARLEETAKMVIKHITVLPDIEITEKKNKPEDREEAAEWERACNEIRNTYARVEVMLETMGIGSPGDFIKEVRKVEKLKRQEDISEIEKDYIRTRKQRLKSTIVESLQEQR